MTRLLATLLFAVLGSAAAQSVDSVTPDAGAFGTPLTIAGTGFGAAKPRVVLTSDADGKTRKLKVLEWSDTQIVAGMRKLPAGAHELQVLRKGKGLEPLAAPAPVAVQLPSEPLFTPASAAAGEEVAMSALGLGTKKGVVKVGGVKAKVLSWSAAGAADGVTPGVVLFRLGKKTPAGSQSVSVKTTAGEALFETALEVMPPDPGGGGGPGIPGNPFSQQAPGMSCEMDGVLTSFAPVYKSSWSGGTTNYKVVGEKDAGFTKFDIRLDYQQPAGPTKTKSVQQPKVHLIYSSLSTVYTTTLDPNIGDVIPGTSATLTYTGLAWQGPPSFQTSSFGGAFSGTLVKVQGIGPDTMTITNGYFWTASTSN